MRNLLQPNTCLSSLIHPLGIYPRKSQHRCLSLLHTLRASLASSTKKQTSTKTYPCPRKVPWSTEIFGRRREDEYRWMQSTNDPAISAHMEKENRYTDHILSETKSFKKTLIREMSKRLQTSGSKSEERPSKVGDFEYYTRWDRSGQLYCRKKWTLGRNAPEEIIIHPVKDLPPHAHGRVQKLLISADQSRVAYMVPQGIEGTEVGDVWLKELSNFDGRERRRGKIIQGAFNFVWASDNQTVYYTLPDEQLRPCRVLAHQIGSHPNNDIVMHTEPNEEVFLDVGLTKDKRFVTISGNTLNSSEVRVIDAHFDFAKEKHTPDMIVIRKREEGVEYYVDHHENTFFIVTNADGAIDFKVVVAPTCTPQKEYWKELVPASEEMKIEDVDVFRNFVVIYARRRGYPVIICHDVRSDATRIPNSDPDTTMSKSHEILLPMKFCVVLPDANSNYDTDKLRFTLNSPLAHDATFEYDMKTKGLEVLDSSRINGFDPEKYTIVREFADSSHDGTAVPVTLIHQKGLSKDGSAPLLIHCYGAYGMSTEPEFRPGDLALLERGWVIALAHVRGGGELGKRWYEGGRVLNKKNSMYDLIAVADHLVKTGYTSKEKMAGIAGSAGGLVLASVGNMRPDLFQALILRVPFVDPISSMLDPSEPLTTVEYLEWGNPGTSQEVYDYMVSYAPYDTIPKGATSSPKDKQKKWPSVYVSTGKLDRRVSAWQGLKYVARLRDQREAEGEGGSAVVLRVWNEGGHFGEEGVDADGNGNRLKDLAEEIGFLKRAIDF